MDGDRCAVAESKFVVGIDLGTSHTVVASAPLVAEVGVGDNWEAAH